MVNTGGGQLESQELSDLQSISIDQRGGGGGGRSGLYSRMLHADENELQICSDTQSCCLIRLTCFRGLFKNTKAVFAAAVRTAPLHCDYCSFRSLIIEGETYIYFHRCSVISRYMNI